MERKRGKDLCSLGNNKWERILPFLSADSIFNRSKTVPHSDLLNTFHPIKEV